MTSGDLQVTDLGPLLFNIIDIFDNKFFSKLFAYADNLKIIGNQNTYLNVISRQRTINKIDINITKCTVLHFGNSNKNQKIFINNTALENRNSERDLSLIVDINFSFNQHIKFIKSTT